jgi:lipoic acid synthetase
MKIKVSLDIGKQYREVKHLLKTQSLSTVCEEAKCPNLIECWSSGTATIMIMGDTCTRGCRFCHIKTSKNPMPLDPLEPKKVAQTIESLKLKYVVITSVDRDDLPDQGSQHFFDVVSYVQSKCPETKIEVLIPDFQGNHIFMRILANSNPYVIAQNIEVVKSLTRKIRDPRASYDQTLNCLRFYKKEYPSIYTKSSLMVGLGETHQEIYETLQDLKNSFVDIVTIGQYYQPSSKQVEVKKYYAQEEFLEIQRMAQKLGFSFVFSGAHVRSSYKASEYIHALS